MPESGSIASWPQWPNRRFRLAWCRLCMTGMSWLRERCCIIYNPAHGVLRSNSFKLKILQRNTIGWLKRFHDYGIYGPWSLINQGTINLDGAQSTGFSTVHGEINGGESLRRSVPQLNSCKEVGNARTNTRIGLAGSTHLSQWIGLREKPLLKQRISHEILIKSSDLFRIIQSRLETTSASLDDQQQLGPCRYGFHLRRWETCFESQSIQTPETLQEVAWLVMRLSQNHRSCRSWMGKNFMEIPIFQWMIWG